MLYRFTVDTYECGDAAPVKSETVLAEYHRSAALQVIRDSRPDASAMWYEVTKKGEGHTVTFEYEAGVHYGESLTVI